MVPLRSLGLPQGCVLCFSWSTKSDITNFAQDTCIHSPQDIVATLVHGTIHAFFFANVPGIVDCQQHIFLCSCIRLGELFTTYSLYIVFSPNQGDPNIDLREPLKWCRNFGKPGIWYFQNRQKGNVAGLCYTTLSSS